MSLSQLLFYPQLKRKDGVLFRYRYTIYNPRTGVDVLRPPCDEVVGDEAAVDGVGGEAGQAQDGGVAEVATRRGLASAVVADRQLVQQRVLGTGEVTLAR